MRSTHIPFGSAHDSHSGYAHEICKHRMAMFRRDAFGVKLNAVNGQRGMAETHDVTVIAGRVDDQSGRDIFDNQGMVTRGLKRGRQPYK